MFPQCDLASLLIDTAIEGLSAAVPQQKTSPATGLEVDGLVSPADSVEWYAGSTCTCGLPVGLVSTLLWSGTECYAPNMLLGSVPHVTQSKINTEINATEDAVSLSPVERSLRCAFGQILLFSRAFLLGVDLQDTKSHSIFFRFLNKTIAIIYTAWITCFVSDLAKATITRLFITLLLLLIRICSSRSRSRSYILCVDS